MLFSLGKITIWLQNVRAGEDVREAQGCLLSFINHKALTQVPVRTMMRPGSRLMVAEKEDEGEVLVGR